MSNVNINGYVLHSQHSNSSAGGVALYVKSNLDHFIREDLPVLEDEFKTLGVEIKNSKGQTFLCCCAYIHPHTDIKKLNDHTNVIMQKYSKEKKLL